MQSRPSSSPPALPEPPLAIPFGEETQAERVATLERTVEVLVARLVMKDMEIQGYQYKFSVFQFMLEFASYMLVDEDRAALGDLLSNPEYLEIHSQTGFNWPETESKLKKITDEYLNRRGKQ